MAYTPVNTIGTIVESVRSAFNDGVTKDLNWRKQQLKQLSKCIKENEQEVKNIVVLFLTSYSLPKRLKKI